MSNEAKFFTRPKVRFSQSDMDKSGVEKLTNSMEPKATVPLGKPKITSIVKLDKPVKVVKSVRTFDSHKNKESKPVNKVQKKDSLTVHNNKEPSCTVPRSSSKDNPIKTENQKPLSDSNNAQNIKANSEKTDVSEVFDNSPNNDIVPSSIASVQDKSLENEHKSNTVSKVNVSEKSNVKDDKGKENDASIAKKNTSIIKKGSDKQSVRNKTKPSSSVTSTKKPNVIDKPSTCIPTMRKLKSKSAIGVMPCHKHSRDSSKAKPPPVKKTMIRDIIGPKIKPYIGPGMGHAKKDDKEVSKTEEKTLVKACVSGEKLAKPEYNSIMSTINKLNEIRKQKVVTDIEHLPHAYKNYINGKMSSALDFPLDEAVYKNLVDLSIDEHQLPSRLTRSKDPEPRQKDIAPVLSDFFTPTSAEEYCTAVSVKPRAPETIGSWNAFKISDKIFEWKHALNYA